MGRVLDEPLPQTALLIGCMRVWIIYVAVTPAWLLLSVIVIVMLLLLCDLKAFVDRVSPVVTCISVLVCLSVFSLRM